MLHMNDFSLFQSDRLITIRTRAAMPPSRPQVLSVFLLLAKRPLLQATDQKERLLKKYQKSLRQERTRFLNSLVGIGLSVRLTLAHRQTHLSGCTKELCLDFQDSSSRRRQCFKLDCLTQDQGKNNH